MAANALPTSELRLETSTVSEGILVRCIGKITINSSSLLQTTVRKLMPETKCILLDLAEVTFVDSSGLGAIVSVKFYAKRQNCELKLMNPSGQGRELLRITNLASLLD